MGAGKYAALFGCAFWGGLIIWRIVRWIMSLREPLWKSEEGYWDWGSGRGWFPHVWW